MKNRSWHIGELHIIKRLPQSMNGNARFMVYIGGFSCVTPVDSSVADRVKNYAGKQCKAMIGTHYGVAMLDYVELWEK